MYSPYNEIIISEYEVEDTEFVIGGTMDGATVKNNLYGQIKYQKEPHSAICESNGAYVDCLPDVQTNNYVTLSSSTYVLEITDANGRTISQEVELTSQDITFNYTVSNLGTKFLTKDSTTKSFICGAENEFYGVIRITSFYVDGYEFKIDTATLSTPYSVIKVTGEPLPGTPGEGLFNGTVTVNFKLESLLDDPTSECLCDRPNDFVTGDGWFEFHVYEPGQYNITMSLECGNNIYVGDVTQTVNVGNGEEFDVKLNNMPVRFMLGPESNRQSNFYNAVSVAPSPNDTSMSGWRQAYLEESYNFNLFPTTEEYQTIWSKYINDLSSITDITNKKKIIKYKFDAIFGLSSAVYMCNLSSNFSYTAIGGVDIPLNRALHPNYNQTEEFNEWIYSDESQVTNSNNIPNIVASNYSSDGNKSGNITNGAKYNDLFKVRESGAYTSKYIGNYFSAFSNNGRYINSYSGDCSAKSVSIPDNTAVNLVNENGGWKILGDKYIYETDEMVLANALGIASIAGRSDAVCNNLTNRKPYLRAMYVDRKLDYDLLLFTPTNAQLYVTPESSETDKNIPVTSARVSGFTYNGIEMSYDDEYNVISVDENGNPDKRLEYSYNVSEGNSNCYTIHNKVIAGETNYLVWNHEEEDAISQDNKDKIHYIPRYHTVNVNDGIDLKNFFWSSFNEGKINSYITNKQGGSGEGIYIKRGQKYYVFKHNNTDGYNGEYDLNTYPTKRLIDVGNIVSSTRFKLSLASCSYNFTTSYNEGNIIARIRNKKTDNFEFNIKNSNVIKFFIKENPEFEFGHFRFERTDIDADGYSIFSCGHADLKFKYNTNLEASGFNVYPMYPVVLRVLNNTFGVSKPDGVTYLKSTSKNDGLYGENNLGQRLYELAHRRLTKIYGPSLIGGSSCLSTLSPAYAQGFHGFTCEQAD